MKKIIDERQELEMMKVERTGFWIMWGVLLLSLLVQSLFLGARRFKMESSLLQKNLQSTK